MNNITENSEPKNRKLRIVFKPRIYIDAAKEWRWTIKAGNGKIIGASTEGFSSKQGSLNNLRLVANAINEFCDKETE